MRPFAGLLALVLLEAVQPLATAQTPWEKVTSKDGQFTVEMPARPSINRSRTRRAPGGTVRVLKIGCKTDSGVYMAYRIDLPTAIVPGGEQGELDSARDDIVQEWDGKVLAEKKVRIDGRIGRDFTVRGKPIEEEGIITMRARLYLAGKSIFAVVVTSAPNRELPEDAGRFLGSLALGRDLVRAAGGLEPEPKGKELAGWGLAIDSDGDCQFRPDEKALTVEVPGTWHDLNPHINKLNSPRVVRTVDGDFSVSVKVTGAFKPGGKSTNPKSIPYNGGGIVVWSNSDNFIRLERGAFNRNGKVVPVIIFLEREAGAQGAEHNELYAGGDCYLRMERKGSRINGSISTDGSRWKPLKPIDTLWPSQLKVGVTVANANSQPLTVRFEDLALTGNVVGGTPAADVPK